MIYVPGAVFGRMTVLKALGGTDAQRLFRVRWGCCGREETVTAGTMRSVRRGRAPRRGMACLACITRAHEARWAVADAEVARPLKPRPRQPGPRPGLNEVGPWQTTPAVLPEGVLSAAVAWPRVGG
jgi:hypothetical protein